MHLESNTTAHSAVLHVDHRPNSHFSTNAVQNCALQTPPPTATSTAAPSPLSPIPPVRQNPPIPRGRSAQPSDDTVRLATQLVRQHGSQIGQYGLTAATAVRDQSVVGVAVSVVNGRTSFPLVAPPRSRPAHAWKPPENHEFSRPATPKSFLDRKRSVDAGNLDTFCTPAKKARRLPPGRLDLGNNTIPLQASAEAFMTDGVSPLFFSSSLTRPSMSGRPPSFSTAGPAAAMLNRLREEQNVVRTVKLPKGHVSSASPARTNSMSTPGSAGTESLSSRGSGDQRQLPSELRDLQGLSVIDLLEADERPTFIIDLANATNFGPGPLKFLFMNASLRASQGVRELISQSPECSGDFSRFKSWAVSFVRDNRPMNVSLPSLSYGGITWTCSTLANRFRFVSGSASAVSITPTSPAPPARASAVIEQRSRGPTPSKELHTPGRERALSDLDYFGDAEPDQSLMGSRRAQSEPRDFRDVRPETPVNQTSEVVDYEELDPEDGQTFDWTRIQDINGMLTSPMSPKLVTG